LETALIELGTSLDSYPIKIKRAFHNYKVGPVMGMYYVLYVHQKERKIMFRTGKRMWGGGLNFVFVLIFRFSLNFNKI